MRVSFQRHTRNTSIIDYLSPIQYAVNFRSRIERVPQNFCTPKVPLSPSLWSWSPIYTLLFGEKLSFPPGSFQLLDRVRGPNKSCEYEAAFNAEEGSQRGGDISSLSRKTGYKMLKMRCNSLFFFCCSYCMQDFNVTGWRVENQFAKRSFPSLRTETKFPSVIMNFFVIKPALLRIIRPH